ncbi:MAG: carboxypeptidase regulatory-like domain-containing protein, partial [Acidobacteria bacterium]|nr:carboxypeptidase regulatory-like domain-containing protein [Acidobacteriota bacterium]
KRELKEQEGLDFDSLRDRRGEPYQLEFDGEGQNLLLSVRSRNKASGYDPRGVYQKAEFAVWHTTLDYFDELRTHANAALRSSLQALGRAPRDEKEIREILLQGGISPEDLLDPWGQPYYFGIRSWVANTDRYTITRRAQYGQPLREQMEFRPVSQQFYFVSIQSAGKDTRAGTLDDFTVGVFYHTNGELDDLKTNQIGPVTGTVEGMESLQGLILDPNGAVVVGATVRVTNPRTGLVQTTTTDDEGLYRFMGLLEGERYNVEATASGFATSVFEQVPVSAVSFNNLDITLGIATTSNSVEVTDSGTALIQSTQSQLSQTYTPNQLASLPFNGSIDNLALLTPGIVSAGDRDFRNGVGISGKGNRGRSNNFQIDGQDNNGNRAGGRQAGQISTPRVREYFPETLLWQPSLETDADGRAQFSFKLADNITTWKMSVIGSTVDGRIGVADGELRAFQPFFIEHDPPRVLTEGDRIELPVVLRNYLEQPQEFMVELRPESWFTLLGDSQQRATVKAGDATRAVFSLRVAASVTDGKQRVTATGTDASDAIEKPVTVHPDGEEMTVTKGLVMKDSATMELSFPADAIVGSTRAELKIYPGMMSHLIESIEGIMQRPYGCGEQTISSTYPSLLALRAYKQSGTSSPIQAKAERYLRLGYERLLGYRANGGGFTYWGHGDADFALSAYALRFLSEAREFLPVDEKALEETRAWLLRQQLADGSWHDPHDGYGGAEGAARDAKLTAYITRLLLMSRRGTAGNDDAQNAALARALDYLRQCAPQLNDSSYAASYALAAIEAGEPARATEAIGKLRALSQDEGSGSSWASNTATPFYGWGQAERIETTALVVQALTRFGREEDQELASRGLLYLLGNKDRYGVWYSTQATVNVLDALITSMTDSKANGATGETDEALIFVNGQRATAVRLPPDSQPSAPLSVDLSQYLAAGTNSITIRRAGALRPAAVQAVQSYYVPWDSPAGSGRNASAASRALRLAVSYDRTEVAVGDSVTCRVQAGRMSGASYYGMLLAEIGLPPGADVDRASLEKAMNESGWSLSRYDVLPDRLVVYLWPRMSGVMTSFEFKFRTRFGLTAQTASSVLYDYYNPEARTVLAPTRFTVR